MPSSPPSTPRVQVLDLVASRVPAPGGEDCVRVAVDGVDGAGKTTFADDLAERLTAAGRAVVRVGADGFHHRRAVRHRRGRESPEGFFWDSYDLEALHRHVLDPLGPGGSRRYRPAVHDVRTDEVLDLPPRLAPSGAVLVLDGMFLHRPELAGVWDLSLFLDVPFAVTAARMAVRDGTHPDPDHASMARYVEGQRLYLRTCDPRRRAHLVVDGTDPARLAVVAPAGKPGP